MRRGLTVLATSVLVLGTWVAPIGAMDGAFFDDEESLFEADIEWLAAAGVTKGCNPPFNDEFCPDSYVTRGQMAAFLVRALDLTDPLDDPFTDDDDSIFEADIEKLAKAGITKGCNPPANDRYCPEAKVTRGQMAAFLVRALHLTDDGGRDLFIDDDDSIFEADIDKLGTAGITKGCNPPANTRYCPTDYVTRGQMAAFLHRALKDSRLVVSGAVFEDLDGDGRLDPGEPSLPGMWVASGATSGMPAETYTNSEGRYYLPRLGDTVWVQSWPTSPRVETSPPFLELGEDDSGTAVNFGQSSCGGLSQSRLRNPSPAQDDRFGHAVAASGGRVAVATMDGDVYVYTKVSGVWQPTQIQEANGRGTFAPWQTEGQYLALEGDVLVVGTALAEATGYDSGAVRVYTEQAGEWTLTEIVAATVDWGDELGYSVDIDNGRVVAGAPKDSSVLNYAGAAYVFDNTSTGWNEVKLASPDPDYWEWFGASVAVDEDTVVVSESVAFETDTAGTVHVFTPEGTAWRGTQLASSPLDQLGWSVAADGGWIVAGAPQIRLYGQDVSRGPGYVQVFVKHEGTYASWSLPSWAAPGAEFGYDVAIHHDATSDEYLVVAGAPRQEPFGAAHLYGPASSAEDLYWDEAVCVPWDGEWNDHFGEAVAINEGIVVVGAPLADFENPRDGAVYVYESP